MSGTRWLTLAAVGLVVAGCTGPPTPLGPGPSRSAAGAPTAATGSARPATTGPAVTAGPPSPEPPAEPTTTNTLPPPPAPTAPEPRTSGALTARSLPVPSGWRTVVRQGGPEEGYQGNGTWTHGRDPRYAAQDAITVGCAPVTRDDYPDPVAALEGTYSGPGGVPGVGLALQFRSTGDANAYWTRYTQQLRRCTDPDGPVLVRLLRADEHLVGQRTYPDGDWTEVGLRHRERVTVVALTDPGHRIGAGQQARLLAALRDRSRR